MAASHSLARHSLSMFELCMSGGMKRDAKYASRPIAQCLEFSTAWQSHQLVTVMLFEENIY